MRPERRLLVHALLAGGMVAAWRPAHALELNTASRAELEQLNGVGVTMADRLLEERARRPFRDWDDLAARVKGMRGSRAQRLREQGVTIAPISAAREQK